MKMMTVGLTVKYVGSNLAGYSGTAYAADLAPNITACVQFQGGFRDPEPGYQMTFIEKAESLPMFIRRVGLVHHDQG
jgi:hypothetical protein